MYHSVPYRTAPHRACCTLFTSFSTLCGPNCRSSPCAYRSGCFDLPRLVRLSLIVRFRISLKLLGLWDTSRRSVWNPSARWGITNGGWCECASAQFAVSGRLYSPDFGTLFPCSNSFLVLPVYGHGVQRTSIETGAILRYLFRSPTFSIALRSTK